MTIGPCPRPTGGAPSGGSLRARSGIEALDRTSFRRPDMRMDCPRCRRVLEYTGHRPSFCAYCGAPLEGQADGASTVPLGGPSADLDTDPERTGPAPRAVAAETVEYRS